jgi:hypothetical protein
MKLLFSVLLAAVYLCLLWGPSYLVARARQRAGQRSAFRPLRLILPTQLVLTFALLLVADEIGVPNPAGLFAAVTAALSLAGALACKLLGWFAARRA